MPQQSLPIGRIIKSPQIRLQLPRQDPQRSALPDTIGANKPKYLSRSRGRQSVQLERVGGVPVSDFCVQVGGQVNNVDGAEGTLLGTNTAADTIVNRAQGAGDYHSVSEMKAILLAGVTSMQSFPVRTTGPNT
jgi:hypothetical protein